MVPSPPGIPYMPTIGGPGVTISHFSPILGCYRIKINYWIAEKTEKIDEMAQPPQLLFIANRVKLHILKYIHTQHYCST